MLEFRYLGWVLNKPGTDESECRRKVAGGRRDAGAIMLMLGVCSLIVLGFCMSHSSCLFLCKTNMEGEGGV